MQSEVVVTISNQQNITTQIMSDHAIDRVKFATKTYAPIIVLGEKYHQGYWPSSVHDFIHHCDMVSTQNPANEMEFRLQSKEKLRNAQHILDWFHGKAPAHSVTDEEMEKVANILGRKPQNQTFLLGADYGVPVYTLLYPGLFNELTLEYTWDEAGFEKGNFVAFYYCFCPFNFGKKIRVLGKVLGNHVGDWEYVAVVFIHFVPAFAVFKPHSFGNAVVPFPRDSPGAANASVSVPCPMPTSNRHCESHDPPEYFKLQDANLRFYCRRPVVYCAEGTHAMWPSSGRHFYSPAGTPSAISRDIVDACGDGAPTTAVWMTDENLEIIPPEMWLGNVRPLPSPHLGAPTVNWLTDCTMWGNLGMSPSGAGGWMAKIFADQSELCDGPRGFDDRIPFAAVMKQTSAANANAATTGNNSVDGL